MSYKAFKKKVTDHLASYNKWEHGSFNGKGDYPYIVRIDGKTKMEIVKAIMLKDGLTEGQLDMFRNPHRYAYHLNSSQVLCYEFFRKLLRDDGTADEQRMLPVLGRMGIPTEPFVGAKAEFEKEFADGEGTNFDFWLGSVDGKHNLYIEVKYTEQGFGSCEYNGRHLKKFDNVYSDMIKSNQCIPDEVKSKIEFPQMREYYQLFRNTLRVKGEGDYVVFLFPDENSIAKAQFEAFREKYLHGELSSHVLGCHWEDLKDLMDKEFRKKFFDY